MNVLDDLLNAARLSDILIPSSTSLPKTIPSAIRATAFQLRKEFGSVAAQIADGLAPGGFLHGIENSGNSSTRTFRNEQQMNVFRHDDPSPKVESVFDARGYKGLQEPGPRPILRENRKLAITGEGQESGVPGFIVAFEFLAVWRHVRYCTRGVAGMGLD